MSKSTETKNRILKNTRQLIVEKGFNNTSISDIVAATGVTKGNLYYYFSSKDDLGLAVLKDAEEEFFDLLDNSFQGENALDKVWNSCEMILRVQCESNFVGGCLFGNTALEMSDTNPDYAKIISEVFRRWTTLLAGHLSEASELGELKIEIRPDSLARVIVAVIEGGIMMARVSKNKKELEDCLATLKKIFES